MKKVNHSVFGNRRSFLKNMSKVGFSSALLNAPLAGSGLLWTRGALAAEDGVAPKRLVTIHVTNGAHPETWHPTGQGNNFTLPQGSAPFEAVKDKCLFFDGFTGVGGHGPHHYCVSNDKDTSLDIYASKIIGADNPYASLHMAAATQGGLSRINRSGIPFELNPLSVYERLFPQPQGGGGTDWTTIRRQGILGTNLQMLNDLQSKVNGVQSQRLQLHADSVEALSRRITKLASGGSAACTRPFWDGLAVDGTNLAADAVDRATVDQRTDLFMDLSVMALKCDLTRVITFSFGDSGAEMLVPGVDESWHGCQHGYRNELKNPVARSWFSSKMVNLMNQLAEEPDLDGRTMLDNTLIYLTSDMGNGSSHINTRTPIILAGNDLNAGRVMDMGGIKWDGLFDTIAVSLGIDIDAPDYPQYGNGAGVIPSVLA
ncbi:DUF1552 domain-containing protein [Marinicellulosiphila megalodicopiae]|uniref:DUF1552 domain-containing protein n=1 Tax=Marinicellulosiphila megalodicopiae TaxID=2724896 RepID=UPI003BB12867